MHKQACALCTNIRFKWLWDFFQIPYTHLPLENSAEPYRSPYINFYTFNSVCLKATGWFVLLTHNAQHTRIQPSCCLRIAELSYVACQSTPTHTHTHTSDRTLPRAHQPVWRCIFRMGKGLNYGEGERGNKHGADTARLAQQHCSQSQSQVGSRCRFAHPVVKCWEWPGLEDVESAGGRKVGWCRGAKLRHPALPKIMWL